jgi:hypothetical protein
MQFCRPKLSFSLNEPVKSAFLTQYIFVHGHTHGRIHAYFFQS